MKPKMLTRKGATKFVNIDIFLTTIPDHESPKRKRERSKTTELEYVELCQKCDNSYATSGHLTTHMRKHTGERPFTCEICERNFTESRMLNVHLRIHTGEKPYTCTVYENGLSLESFNYMARSMYSAPFGKTGAQFDE